MSIIDREMVWRQFGAAIDTLGNALHACPDELWEEQLWPDQPGQWVAQGFSKFWYLGYHALFWLDLYLTGTEEGFAPPAPFDLTEMREGEMPPRTYSRAELLNYLEHCRRRCQETLAGLSQEQASRVCSFGWGQMPFAELLLYNLRHVQEHAAQLHLFLGQRAGRPSRWVKQAK
ncbi:MAG TPA: DinB family protein [Roseiflexaceae bacterium]|nr:DinB family protein [Roseiflexaceae bacterium]